MKPIAFCFILFGSLILTGATTFAQNKLGCISMNELMTAMPEFKKADTTLAQYRSALEQEYESYKTQYSEQAVLLTSPDTTKFTKPQLDIKRKSLAELLAKLQGYDEEAGQLLNQKRSSLLLPIQKKAEDAIQQVSKDNGYAFVFEKETLHAFPPSEDILPLVKKRLGLR
ncbi:MAG TPA: OmpH family outer membrane protein [Puia sp.]|nr:OmpH family outer membrane protein [Puia sp.]